MNRSHSKFPTISQINPVAPMALEGHFTTHEKQNKLPFNPEPKRAKCVKIILNSGDRSSGSLTSALFNIKLPEYFQNKRLNLVVDSFIVSSSPNSVANLSLFPYYVRLAEMRNPYSYSSTTSTTSGNILLTTGTSYFNNMSRETGGTTITDTTLFNRPITVEIFSPHFDTSAANGISNPWSIQISLFDDVPEGDENPL